MADLPNTVIFADNEAQRQYLADIAKNAGFCVVKEPHAGSLCLTTSDAANVFDDCYKILSLPKILPKKFRASDLMKLLQTEQDLRMTLPAEVKVKNAILNTRQNLWRVSGVADVQLTQKETQLICYLKEKNRPVSRGELLSDVWGYVDGLETHTLETHIYRLRQKIEEDSSNPIFIITKEDGYEVCDDIL